MHCCKTQKEILMLKIVIILLLLLLLLLLFGPLSEVKYKSIC
jgi:hypothetical protein